MIKKIWLFVIAFLTAGVGMASAPAMREQAVVRVGTATTVSISATVWTKVPATSSLVGRIAIAVNNPSTNSNVFGGIISTSSVTPGEAVTVMPLEFAPSTDFSIVPVGDGLYLYLVSPAGAQNVHVQELSQ